MKVLDLTHTITNDMTIFPGGEQPKNEEISNVADDGYKVTQIHINSHNGTHMDAPAHVLENGVTLDKLDAINFVGKAALIDCSDLDEGDIIGYNYIEKNQDIINKADFIVFKTNWSKYWNTEKYLGKYPVISEEVIDYIISAKKKGVAFDTISVDSVDNAGLTKHHRLLSNNVLVFENLTNLDLIDKELFIFCGLPLKFKDSDGAPIRAIAMLD